MKQIWVKVTALEDIGKEKGSKQLGVHSFEPSDQVGYSLRQRT